jgi:hypothetical protein
VRDGARLERVLRETPPKDPTVEVRFDVEKVGPVGIHRVTLKMDDDARRVFGDNPVYLAFRDDAVLFTAGPRGLGLLKDTLEVAPASGKVMQLQVAASRLAPLAKQRSLRKLPAKFLVTTGTAIGSASRWRAARRWKFC